MPLSWRAEFYRWCKQVRRSVLDKPHDHEPEAIADSDAGDPRDVLIVSQALRIVQLERRVRELEQCVCSSPSMNKWAIAMIRHKTQRYESVSY